VFLVGDRLVVATFVLETCASAPTFRRLMSLSPCESTRDEHDFVFDMNVSTTSSAPSDHMYGVSIYLE
jgi:hypothetical protein